VSRNLWVLARSLIYVAKSGRVYTVPDGFPTDFASVPRLLWPILPVTDAQYDASACLHDYVVRHRVALGLTLMDCHALFREALEARHVGRGLRNAMYGAVVAVNWTCAGPGDGSIRRDMHRALIRRGLHVVGGVVDLTRLPADLALA
jgi:hypothetical protein